ncbi:MAG: hypothetical protein LUE93_16315 [Bacteroides sp.]|nr:hypothetical protein [Bacteroides sp.]
MNYRLNYWLTAILLCGFMVFFGGCSDDESGSESPLTVGELRDGVLTLYYPGFYVPRIYIKGGTPPYEVSGGSDILQVKMDEDMESYFRCEISDVGRASVTVSDAVGDKITFSVVIEYNDIYVKVVGHDVEVTGEELTVAQHKELQEKALSAIPVNELGGYRLAYSGKDSGILYVHKDVFDSYRTEGTFKLIYQDEEEKFRLRYWFEFEDQVHTFYRDLYRSSPRAELAPVYAFYEDLTEQFLPDYPGLEKLVTIQILN